MSLFVYHKLPENMQGTTLYPLNKLKETFPEIYEEEVKKYEGRERLLRMKVPTLDCLWNDVLHLSPIPPEKIFNTLREIGFDYEIDAYLKINVEKLDKRNLTVFFDDVATDFDPAKFFDIDSVNFEELQEIPKHTIAYYKECFEESEHPLLFAGIPHVLHKGSLNLDDCEIVKPV